MGHLIKSGKFDVSAYDANDKVIEEAEKAGAIPAPDVKAAVHDAG